MGVEAECFPGIPRGVCAQSKVKWLRHKLTGAVLSVLSELKSSAPAKVALGLDKEQLNIPEEIAQESEDEISDGEMDDLGDDESSDEDWSWAADIPNVDIK